MENWQGNLDPRKNRQPASLTERGASLKLGNPALDAKKMLSRLRKADPRTGEPYDPGLSREEKLEKITEGMDYIKETVFKQYQTIAVIAREIQGFTEENPEATGREVLKKFRPDDRYLNLSEKQASLTQAGIREIADRIDTVNRYFQEYSDRPKELLAQVFGLSADALEGEMILTKSSGVLNFVVKDQKTFTQLRGRKDKTASGASAFLLVGSKIPELQGAVCVSSDLSEENLKGILTHEKRHAINRFLTPDRHEQDPLVRAKEEIIAYLEEGSSPAAIKKVLTDKREYDFMFGTPKESDEWQHYCAEVRFLVDMATHIKKSDGKMDIELLGVTPIRQWRLLFEKINAERPLPAREAAKLYYETLRSRKKIIEAVKDLAPGDVLVTKNGLMIVIDQVEGDNISGYYEGLNEKYTATRSYLIREQDEAEPLYKEIRKCRDERVAKKIIFKKMLERVIPGDILMSDSAAAFVQRAGADELTIENPHGEPISFSKGTLVSFFDSPEGLAFNRVYPAKEYEIRTAKQDFSRELDNLASGDLLIMKDNVVYEVRGLSGQEIVLKVLPAGQEQRVPLRAIKSISGDIIEIRKNLKALDYEVFEKEADFFWAINRLKPGDQLVTIRGSVLEVVETDAKEIKLKFPNGDIRAFGRRLINNPQEGLSLIQIRIKTGPKK